jgi:hypothetical protein
MRRTPSRYRPRLWYVLFLILLLALLRGLLYLVVFPPWQHYDEPTHFEHVRLIAERGQFPEADDYDLGMRREIAASMVQAGFWKDVGVPEIDFWSASPPSIGITELVHPPLYYALLALPQPLVAHQGVEAQLYLARLGSVLLNLALVASAYGLVAEISPGRRMLPVAVATFIAFLPPVTDLMSAVNNDAGAAAAVSLLLWAAVRLIRRGPTPGRVLIVLLLAAVCYGVKSTAGVVALIVLLAIAGGYLVKAVWQASRQRWLWIGTALLAMVFLVTTFSLGKQAAYWLGLGQPADTNRVVTDAVLGRAAFVLASGDARYPEELLQEVNVGAGEKLRGQTVTLGAWLRADRGGDRGQVVPVELGLYDGSGANWHRVEATGNWQFFAFSEQVGPEVPGVTVRVRIAGRADGDQAPTGLGVTGRADEGQVVHIDGIVLAEGALAAASPPAFETDDATAGKWDGQRFENLVRNASAERTWPALRAWAGNQKVYRVTAVHVFQSLLDWRRTGWVYGPELRMLLQSFWGRFGWNHLGLPDVYYYPLYLLVLAGVAGAILRLVRWLRADQTRPLWQGHALAVLGAALAVGWGSAVMRIHPVLVTINMLWPVARYAAVVIVPTTALLCVGWAEIVPRRWRKEAAWVGLLGLLALDALAVGTVILPYYYG